MKPIKVLRRHTKRGKQIVFIPAGTATFNVPYDWNSANNKIRCLGSGGTAGPGAATTGGFGGGGGGYSEITNLALTPNTLVNCQVPAGNASVPCWFSSTATVSANSSNGSAGAILTSAVGTIKNGGGNGGGSGNPTGSGGGGCGGPDAAGSSGSATTSGAGNGGLNGGGAGGAQNGTGSNGNMWTATGGATAGSGGGGGDTNLNGTGEAPGNYGGGGGGGLGASTTGGIGAPGLIVVEWTP
jgi:hypothetical protein